jgi:TonB family protein
VSAVLASTLSFFTRRTSSIYRFRAKASTTSSPASCSSTSPIQAARFRAFVHASSLAGLSPLSKAIMGTQIVVPSGAPLLDQIAVSAVQQAQPFPAPSPDLVKLTGMVTIPLAFEVMAAGKQMDAER